MNNYQIRWIKWSDPLLSLVKDHQRLENEEDYSEDLFQSKDSFSPAVNGIGPAIIGPHGIIPINEANCPSSLFNFWMGHSNFRITEEIADIVDWTDGIESFDIFTPYRFRIGIGKLFNEDIVKKDTENRILFQLKTNDQSADRLKVLQDLLRKQYKYWIILVLETDKLEFISGNDQAEVEQKLNIYLKNKEKLIKKIIKSWE